MNQSDAFERLGKRVADTQDASFDERRVLIAARRRFLSRSAETTAPVGGRRQEVLAYGALGAVLGMALVGGHMWMTRPLSYETEQLRVRVEGARSIVRADRGQGAIRFSDGTVVWLDKGAEAMLSRVHDNGATVDVAEGKARVQVVHRTDGRWRFHFGPFGVRVTGTRFAADWQDSTSEFSLTLTEGSVQISGCGMGEPTTVSAGQSVAGSCVDGRASLRFVTEPIPSPAVSASLGGADHATGNAAPSSSSGSPPAGEERRTPRAASAMADPQEPPPDWEALARKGDFRGAYEAIEKTGFEATCDGAGPGTLLQLADVARLAGRMDRSQRALMLVRQRHPGTRASATAAFELGRMAADRGGSAASAGTWFRTYLQEAPGGPFAREARGRLLELNVASGNRKAAEQAAEDYLRRYPNGPHAVLARSIVGK